MAKLLTCVVSEGTNLFTGEVYPDGVPKERTVSQIFALLQQGHVIEDRTNGQRIQLEKENFFLVNANEILGLHNAKAAAEETTVETPVVTTSVEEPKTIETKEETKTINKTKNN